jgi:hypothetical protein
MPQVNRNLSLDVSVSHKDVFFRRILQLAQCLSGMRGSPEYRTEPEALHEDASLRPPELILVNLSLLKSKECLRLSSGHSVA